ncbi:putative Na(+)-H(+) exchange regulatory cofactor NHE-RF protein [Naja naja]|nr:putative Na(+)-H(+) exchange regulatory cofactor NHE-RF protein [Naja naja]
MDNGGGNEPRLLPRLCCPEKGPNGYGFHLHGEKSKTGQFIRLVEPDSPAEQSGLKAGDRLIEVNGDNVEKESHQQVVNRIRNSPGSVRLLVVDSETDQHLQQLGLQCREEFIRGLPEKPEARSGEQEAARQDQENEMKADREENHHAGQQVKV